jgi:uncharacterized protein (DUF58 family)
LLLRDEPPRPFLGDRPEFNLSIAPGEFKDVEYSVKPTERGTEQFQGTFVRIDCPFGLAVKQVRLETDQRVRIYPNILALKEFDLLRQRGRLKELGIRQSRMRGQGSDFDSLRQYTDGDDFRRIDWNATARKGDLIVRQYQQERNQVVMVCIDIGRTMLSEVGGVRKLDHVLDSLLMLANAAAIAGDMIGLLVFSDTVKRYLPPKKGHAQIGLLIEACHDLVADPLESDLSGAMAYLSRHWKRRSLLVIFTGCEDPDRAQELVGSFLPMARIHLSMLCRVTDPALEQLERVKVNTIHQMYSKSAATLMSQERKDALSKITSVGVKVLDSEPQDLAAKLVNFYLEVKERSLL